MKRALSFLLWLSVAILAFVAYRYISRTHELAGLIAASDVQTSAALAARDSLKRSQDSVVQASIARQDSINTLSNSIATVTVESEHLRAEIAGLKRPAPNDSTNPNWERLNAKNEALAASETQRADSLGKQFALMGADRDMWKSRADALTVSNDSLASALIESRNIVHTQAAISSDRCRIAGLIPCPSRTTTAVGSIVLALVARNNYRSAFR